MTDQWNSNSGPQQGGPRGHNGSGPGGSGQFGAWQGEHSQDGCARDGYRLSEPHQGGYHQAGYHQAGYPQGGYHQQSGWDSHGNQQYNQYGPSGPRRANILLIAVIAGVVLLIGAGVGSYFLFFKSDDAPAAAPVTPGLPANQVPANQVPANQNPANQDPAGEIPVMPVAPSGGPNSATELAAQMTQVFESLDLAAAAALSCVGDQDPAALAEEAAQAQAIQQAGVQLAVTVDSIRENGASAVATFSITISNPTTGQSQTQVETQNLWSNDLGRWMECDNALTAADQF